MPENEKQMIREQLEEITKELVKVEDEYKTIQKKIDRLPNSQLYKLKWLCNEKARLFQRKKSLENEKHNKINLLQFSQSSF